MDDKKKRTRKVFLPILVGEKTKEKFDRKRGSMTADAYLLKLLEK